MKKEVTDLDGLRYMMNMLKEVRARESGIDMEINPILNMYRYVV
jgi:dynein heavy chain, axonemal